MTSLFKNWRRLSRWHGIKRAYYLPVHKGGHGAKPLKALKLKALQALEIEGMGQICFNYMSIRAMPRLQLHFKKFGISILGGTCPLSPHWLR